MNVGFVSLGCTKNLIDTEMAIGLFKNNNYKIVSNVEDAQIIVINTCGFIEAAKEEAINTILEMAEYKQNGSCKYLASSINSSFDMFLVFSMFKMCVCIKYYFIIPNSEIQ